MGTMYKALYASAAAASVALWTLPTSAQIDVDPPLPNLMLLVDTSGSMEYLTNGDPVSVCSPTGTSDLNRWATLVTALTGSVDSRGCYAQDRASTDFGTEYGLGGDLPYDSGYFLPHHRIVSNGCVAGPGTLPVNIYDWPSTAINYHEYGNPSQACTVPFEQSSDGLLDVYVDRVRFGLMTFDPLPDGGTGVSGGLVDYADGIAGMWSYYNDWQGTGSPVTGSLPNCAVKLLEVGARNAAAPPWEGRMIPLGPSDATTLEITETNAHIQEALLTMRPYGATPLAAMMADAYVYYREDTSLDPLDNSNYFGPAMDPMFADGCRKSYLLVLSDGEPNLDLRPYCEATGGNCPFDEPWEIAGVLANPSNPNDQVLTFAVGFGLSADAGVDCNTISMPSDLNSGGLCDDPSGALEACCTLSRIAYEGGTPKAYFADDLSTLKTELQNVIDAVAGTSTSRTMPAFAGAASSQASASDADAVSYEFTTSFKPGIGELWSGNLERHRWVCETQSGALVPVLQDVDETLGDDFAKNLNEGKAVQPRTFYTVVADQETQNSVSVRSSEATIRPNLSSPDDDGLGTYSGLPVTGDLATMVGYGRTDDETKDSGVKRLTTHTIDRVTATELHFFGHSPTQGNICSGDSGGPSFATINGYEVQVGVHSSSVGGCGNEGQDARVDAFAAWITTKAGGDVYQDGATPVRDHGPPRVSILSPTHNALTGTSVTVSASISDDTGVRRAALLVDGRELIGLLRSPFDFRVSALPPGVATVLTVVAEDTVGNEARATITITPTTAAAPVQARPSAPAPWGPPPLSARRAVGGCAVFHTDARSSAPVLFALLCLALRVRLLGGRRARRQ